MVKGKTKVCRNCLKRKEVAKFYKHPTSNGYYRTCRACHIKDSAGRRAKARERYRLYETAKRLKRDFGITLADYNALYTKQRGLCGICGEPERGVSKYGVAIQLAVDHCHVSGNIRKLLCRSCNVGLGNFKDDVKLMRKAIKYLKDHGQ